ncbi:MAG TPA: site-2 protease family protein, partial [Gemmatimonadales bacterium]|nr:site-2 protease family protein [Gemmatimonadales bacterium]
MQEALLALPVLLFSMVAHEYAHGYAALRQGDTTAYMLGRLTFNPLKHIDPFMTVLLPLMLWFGSGGRMVFGGAKPVPVNPRNYRQYKRGDIIVSLAGIATNLVLAV